ncbi:hypothetical protein EBR96_08620, partial [bacterium]|nr:hypothetical protein [bacterium]
NGQFNTPTDIAFDSSGNIYVVEYNGHRVQKFDSNGNYITKWGSLGSGNGQFNNPRCIAVDSAGNVYVSEWGNHRVQKFNSSGTYVTQWGSNGSGDGQFYRPAGMAFDPEGHLMVLDWDNPAQGIQVFDTDGTFVGHYAQGNIGISGELCINSDGRIYVADATIVSGGGIAMFARSVTGAPSAPAGISASVLGNGITLGWTNPTERDLKAIIIRRDTSGYPGSVSSGTGLTLGSAVPTYNLDYVSSTGTYYYSVFAKDKDDNYSVAAQVSAVVTHLPPSPPGALSVTATANGGIYLSWVNPTNPNFQSITIRRSTSTYPLTPADGTAVSAGLTGTSYTDTGLTNGTRYYYSVFAIGSDFTVSVVSTGNATADTVVPGPPTGFTVATQSASIDLSWSNPVVSDFASTMIRWSTSGYPTAISSGNLLGETSGSSYTHSGISSGTYYYTIFARDTAYNYSTGVMGSASFHPPYKIYDGAPITSIPNMIGMAMDVSGNFYVYTYNEAITKYDSSGAFVTSWGPGTPEAGGPYGGFGESVQMTVSPTGFLYVADNGNHRVLKFQLDGTYVSTIGS